LCRLYNINLTFIIFRASLAEDDFRNGGWVGERRGGGEGGRGYWISRSRRHFKVPRIYVDENSRLRRRDVTSARNLLVLMFLFVYRLRLVCICAVVYCVPVRGIPSADDFSVAQPQPARNQRGRVMCVHAYYNTVVAVVVVVRTRVGFK